VIVNMGDVAGLPFATTVPAILGTNPRTGAPIYALSTAGCPSGVPLCPVPAGSLLTLNAASLLAQGYGIPCAILSASDPRQAHCNQPLPDNCDLSGGAATCSAKPGVVLTPTELTLSPRTGGRIQRFDRVDGAAAGYKLFDIASCSTNSAPTRGASPG